MIILLVTRDMLLQKIDLNNSKSTKGIKLSLSSFLPGGFFSECCYVMNSLSILFLKCLTAAVCLNFLAALSKTYSSSTGLSSGANVSLGSSGFKDALYSLIRIR